MANFTQGAKYDHPSYLTRQRVSLGPNTAGATTVSGGTIFPWNVRLRAAQALVRIAGTTTGAASGVSIVSIGTAYRYNPNAPFTQTATLTGTNTLTTFTLGTGAALTISTSTDLDVMIPTSTVLQLKTAGADATVVADVSVEYYLDPTTGVWTGQSN